MKAQRWTVDRWTVDYEDGREPVTVPHAWRQDMDVQDEGPVTYRVKLNLPPEPAHLLFHGVSYAAEVSVDGALRVSHRGIWDEFEVPLDDLAGHQVEVEVRVVKNGGKTYPVGSVASGFIPYVHSTFGGIFREVELILERASQPRAWNPSSRHRVEGQTIFLEDRLFYPRGLLHWGWYPELGHPNPPEETIRREVRNAKRLGFNLVKFCLWLPPHRYLEILRQEDMEAWIELPIWMPAADSACLVQIQGEVEAIVRQYRHHDNVLAWSIGCELGRSVSPAVRERLCRMVKNLTHAPLVGDSSGGAEMYGGDLREFGDFYDYHPYCDLPLYASVLDGLALGPRTSKPVVLGEFNDVDVHRDLGKVHDEMPFWASTMSELNHKGVRWLHELPSLVSSSRFVSDSLANMALVASSVRKAAFVRKTVQENVRARGDISGYVVTGWRDTPISSAGIFDDWGQARFSEREMATWNGEDCLFLIPSRRPPWVSGGNRPGLVDPLNVFAGPQCWRVGMHSERGGPAGLLWRIVSGDGLVLAEGGSELSSLEPCVPREIGEIFWEDARPGDYTLQVEAGGARNSWPVTVVAPLDPGFLADWGLSDCRGAFGDLLLTGGRNRLEVGAPSVLTGSGIAFLLDEGTLAAPFWSEAAFEFADEAFWSEVPFAERWSLLLPVCGDRVIDGEWLLSFLPKGATAQVLMNRIDTRTYREASALTRIELPDGGVWLFTTLRPFGGLGSQPPSFIANPAGVLLLSSLVSRVGSGSGAAGLAASPETVTA